MEKILYKLKTFFLMSILTNPIQDKGKLTQEIRF
jgi:hypothetical protein